MIFVTCNPDNQYFHWQTEVYITNFIKMGIPPEKIYVLWMTLQGNQLYPTQAVKKLEQKYAPVHFLYYKDTRARKHYNPVNKPFLMKEFLRQFPDINKEAIFYHDADILFMHPMDWEYFERGNTWYLSDTVNYIGYQYLKTKGVPLVHDLCKIVGIDPKVVEDNNAHSGGGQYIIKNSTFEYWEKVERDSVDLYDFMVIEEPKWTGKGYPIQKWCAEMWATLWNAWVFGHKTVVHKDLDFVFGTDTRKRAENVNILHNAGVTAEAKDLFYKGAWRAKSPLGEDIPSPAHHTASSIYVDAIRDVSL